MALARQQRFSSKSLSYFILLSILNCLDFWLTNIEHGGSSPRALRRSTPSLPGSKRKRSPAYAGSSLMTFNFWILDEFTFDKPSVSGSNAQIQLVFGWFCWSYFVYSALVCSRLLSSVFLSLCFLAALSLAGEYRNSPRPLS
jgi:hypothetical protein